MFEHTLFVGAHTDDIELFAGATLARLIREDRAVKLLVFSSHRGVTDHTLARKEFTMNMGKLGLSVEDYSLLDWKAVSGEFQARRQNMYDDILALVMTHKIDTVITHNKYDTNQDHQQVRDEVVRCCKGRCTILGGEFPFNQIDGAVPDFYMPVSTDDVATKIQCISAYKSQKNSSRQYFREDVHSGHAALRGAQIGTVCAEAFFVERIKFDASFLFK